GGTFSTPGPFGAGKTVLQHHLAKYSDADIVIIAACGERAGEVVEVLKEFPKLIDAKTKEPLIQRTVIICNTSSMPVAAREASVYMAVTIGEYYRQMGLNVLVLADSTSRWAQAMREISGRLEEIPGEEAFPAYLSSRISAFYERAGVLRLPDGTKGSLTIGGTVSPAGGNFEEPVTQATLAVVGAFLGLSRERANARRYPAIDPLISWSKYLSRASELFQEKNPERAKNVEKAFYFLRRGDEISRRMEVVGLEGIALDEMLIYLKAELYDLCYLQQNAFDQEDAYSSLPRQRELFDLMGAIFNARFNVEGHDEARTFFLTLQNEIKNLNFLPFESEAYQTKLAEIKKQFALKTEVK
ncbi:MAG: V-type ATP synthase subunit A, partial [Parachlamydiales bacterium]